VAALRQALLEAVTPQDIQDIALKLRQQALEGDTAAARLLYSYTLGKPAPTVEPDRLDIEEFGIYQEETAGHQQVLAPVQGVSVALACQLLRAILPGLMKDHFREFAHLFAQRYPDDLQRAAEAQADTPLQVAPSPAAAPTVAPAADSRPAAQPATPRQQQKRPSRQEAPRRSEPVAEPALPSVGEILSFLRAGPDAPLQAALHGQQPADAATVTKPEETANRAANTGHSASAVPGRENGPS
jgi:hypothetical protein